MIAHSRAGKPAHTLSVERMMGLETAAKMLGGQARLAEALGIGDRALRAKLTAERGITASDLTFAAAELRGRAAALVAHAVKLDILTTGGGHG